MRTTIIDLQSFEQEVIGKSYEEIENFLNLPLESKCDKEYVYIIKNYLFGLVKMRLYLYFKKGMVKDYFIGFV